MHVIRVLAIASALAVVVPGTPAGAIERCKLVANYMLEHDDEPEFGVAIHKCADIWRVDLEKFRGRLASGEARWEILDSIQLLDVGTDEVVVSETCGIGSSPDSGIVAIAQETEESEFSRIRAAWRADPEQARWIPIDAASVECWNEAAGFS